VDNFWLPSPLIFCYIPRHHDHHPGYTGTYGEIEYMQCEINSWALNQILETSLAGDTVQAFWAGTSYLLASAVCQPFIVDLSDIFGRRLILTLVVALFTLGTILCSVSHSFGLLLTGRSLQGVGGGGIMAGCLVITTDIVPLRQRPTYYAIVQMAWAIGTLVGPLVGGIIAQSIIWRWIFYINLPFCAIGLLLVPLTVRLTAERPSILERLALVDWIGGSLFISSLCAFLVGITWGGNQFPWSSWRTFVPIIVGFVGLIGSGVWETFGAKRPFIPMTLFISISSVISYICACLQGALVSGLPFVFISSLTSSDAWLSLFHPPIHADNQGHGCDSKWIGIDDYFGHTTPKQCHLRVAFYSIRLLSMGNLVRLGSGSLSDRSDVPN
jgi:MFS family permease